MKITNNIRNQYPALTDEQIIRVIEWNRRYTKACLKETLRKVACGILYGVAALLSVFAVAAVVCTVINLL